VRSRGEIDAERLRAALTDTLHELENLRARLP
jgi:hypothetical protein